MEPNQLQQLAANARLNHWPPHLGVTTEAEKVEYLAQQLDEAADRLGYIQSEADRCGDLEAEIETLEAENAALQKEFNELKAKQK